MTDFIPIRHCTPFSEFASKFNQNATFHIPSMSQRNGGGGKTGSKKGGVGGGLVCAHCKKAGGLGTMKFCARCKRVNYCSVECQKLHWKIGGHKKVCGSGARDTAGASGARGDAPLQNPCPVCLDSEEDAGDPGMCRSCGQMFCESCKKGGWGGSGPAPCAVRRFRCLSKRRFDDSNACWNDHVADSRLMRRIVSGCATRTARGSTRTTSRRCGCTG
jgi:hypothetical protein